MAEQYQSFQGREPTIDVDLFIKKAAQEETVRAAKTAELQRGMQLGIQAYDAYTSGELKQAQTGLAEAQTAAIEQKTAGGGADPQEVLKNRQAQEKLGAMDALKTIGGLVDQAMSGNTVVDLNSTFGGGLFSQAARVDPDGAYRELERAKQTGRLDEEVYRTNVKSIFAVKDAEKAFAQRDYQEKIRISAAENSANDTIKAEASFGDIKLKHPDTKWQNTELVPEQSLNLNPATGRPIRGKNGTYFKPQVATQNFDPERNALIETDPETGNIKVLKLGLPSIYKEQLFNLKNGQALADAYQKSRLGGLTEDEILKPNNVRTETPSPSGLAGRRPVDTAGAYTEQLAKQAVRGAEEGISKIINESPTNSVKESIKRGIREGQGAANRTKNIVTSFQPTTVPVGRNYARVTSASFNPGEAMKGSVGSIQYAKEHLSSLVDGANVEINLPEQYAYRPANPSKGYNEPYIIDPGTVKRIKEDPAYKGLPAKILGMIAIESGGNPAAYNKATGAAGAMQLLPGAAIDGGIDPSLENRLNQEQNVKGGTAYLNRIGQDIAATYTRKMKELQQNSVSLGAFVSSTGQFPKLDPRAELLAYNGGASYVKAAIRAGKLEWDDMVQYIRDVKSTPAEEENIGYANKVIAASLLFIEGGNTSDEAYMNELLSTGILSITPKKPGVYV